MRGREEGRTGGWSREPQGQGWTTSSFSSAGENRGEPSTTTASIPTGTVTGQVTSGTGVGVV